MYPVSKSELLLKVTIVSNNNEQIHELLSNSNDYLESIVVNFCIDGNRLIFNNENNGNPIVNNEITNELIMVSFNNKHKSAYNNINYIKQNKNNLFFVTDKSITEIYFNDTLPTKPIYELTSFDSTGFVIELTFKSERVRNRAEINNGNKFRFVWSNANNKMTVRKLNE